MKFKGIPNQLVRITKIKPTLVRKVPKSIRFDKDGTFETDNPYLIKRLSARYEKIEEVKIDYHKIEYKELQVLYKKKTGISAIGKKKIDIIKELEG